MADDQPWLDRVFAFDDMEIRPTDRGQSYAYNNLSKTGPRPFDFADADIVDAVKNICTHFYRHFSRPSGNVVVQELCRSSQRFLKCEK
jgi:hypothetical protein